MIVFSNAKINIGLNIISKREDGFHNIETIFYPIPLCDIIEAVVDNNSKNDIIISFSGLKIDCKPTENLLYKAYRLLNDKIELPALKVHLHKIIPLGSGLGGGSSNGSHMLKLINYFLNNKFSVDQLLEFASQLGSDCSFFIKNEPCFAEGRGEILSFLNIDLSNYFIVIIVPDIRINTREAYNSIKITNRKEKSLKELIKLPIDNWKYYISNDFEDVVFNWYPQLREIKENLYNIGAVYSSLSGSGSSIYGLFKELPELPDFLKKYFYWIGSLKFKSF